MFPLKNLACKGLKEYEKIKINPGRDIFLLEINSLVSGGYCGNPKRVIRPHAVD